MALIMQEVSAEPEIEIHGKPWEDIAASYVLAKTLATGWKTAQETAEAELLLRMENATSARCGKYLLKRGVVPVKERTQIVKAHTQIRFTVSNGDSTDE